MDATFGAVFIGVILATALYGVSCAQVFYYFQHYSGKDGRGTKAVVISTLVSDTIHQALICHVVYFYVITGYNTPEQLGKVVWSLPGEVIFNAITALIVQCFFTVRIWKFSGRNVFLTGILTIFVLGEFAASIAYAALAIPTHTFAEHAKFRPLSMTVNVLTVAADVLITVVFCVLLHKSRTNLRSSNTMINLLIMFSVQTGMLTSFCAVGSLIGSASSPHTFIYVTFYFLMGRLYCNSLLATLNVRRAISGRAHNDLGISLRPIGDTTIGSKETRGDIRIKTETVQFVTGEKTTGCDGSSIFAQKNTDSPRAVESEYDLEHGRGGQLKVLESGLHLESDPDKSKASSITSV